MPIIGIAGQMGMGKTALLTHLLKQERLKLNRKIMANYHVKQLDAKFLTFEDLLEMSDADIDMRDTAIGISEAHVWIDSRTSSRRTNQLFSYSMLQTGKEDINLYYDTQAFHQVDYRLRDRTDVAILVKRRGDVIIGHCEDRNTGKTQKLALHAPSVYDFYDTKEKVKVPKFAPKRKTAPSHVRDLFDDSVPVL